MHLQEAALVFTSSSKSHKEIESVGTKSIVYYFQGRHRPFLQFSTSQTAYLEITTAKSFVKPGTLPQI